MCITQQWTAVMMLKALEDSKLNLEDLMSRHLPDLQTTWKDTVKVYQLLNHSHVIVKMDQNLAHKQGSGFGYGNLSCALAAKILEQIYQQAYPQQSMTQHNVFRKEIQAYGYGIRIVNEQNVQYYGYTGWGDGYSALNIYIPK